MFGIIGIKDFIFEVKRHKILYSTIFFCGFSLYISWFGFLLSTINDGITIINNIF